MFDSPDRYGKGLDWTGYTVHDAANIFRRFLNQLPQPIVPLEYYEKFREPLRSHQTQAVGDMAAQSQDVGNFDHEQAIVKYQQLITELPDLNRQLLLYILDLLAVFASKSDVNLMTAANLAAIFQPGMLSHPDHDMSPPDYRLSQNVLIFLIENQDSFLIGMSGTAADERTVQEVQSGAAPAQPAAETTANNASALGRSASNASGGADSLRRFGGIRRNVSVSSKNSRQSSVNASPSMPASAFGAANTAGVHRSNTVPSKRSPALSGARNSKGFDSPITPIAISPAHLSPSVRSHSPAKASSPVTTEDTNAVPPPKSSSTEQATLDSVSVKTPVAPGQSKEHLLPGDESSRVLSPGDSYHSSSASRVRKISNLLAKSPLGDDGKEPRQPNKLRKKRMPSSTQPSANSSTGSLAAPESPNHMAIQSHSPMMKPAPEASHTHPDPLNVAATQQPQPSISNTAPTPLTAIPPASQPAASNGNATHEEPVTTPTGPVESAAAPSPSTHATDAALQPPPKSPLGSAHSRSSVTDLSELEPMSDSNTGHAVAGVPPLPRPRKHRWRFGRRHDSPPRQDVGGTQAGAQRSESSVGSSGILKFGRKSTSADAGPATAPMSPSIAATMLSGDAASVPHTAPLAPAGSSMSSTAFDGGADGAVGAEPSSAQLPHPPRKREESVAEESGGEKKGHGFLGKIRAKVSAKGKEHKEVEKEKEKEPATMMAAPPAPAPQEAQEQQSVAQPAAQPELQPKPE